MEQELLKIFDDEGNQIGTATRKDVHRQGFWHEAFHCWFIQREEDKVYIYVQLRSKEKKDYPDLLDITAAGHLLAEETVKDGVREIKEEIGIDVDIEELSPLGIIRYCIEKENFIDKEMANVFLYECSQPFSEYELQQEEVAGIYRIEWDSFKKLWEDGDGKVQMEGFEIGSAGEKIYLEKEADIGDFVPHDRSYYQKVIKGISQRLDLM